MKHECDNYSMWNDPDQICSDFDEDERDREAEVRRDGDMMEKICGGIRDAMNDEAAKDMIEWDEMEEEE